MKKQYQVPATQVYKTELTSHILTGSTTTMTVEKADFDSSTMTSLSRDGGSLWNDDEE